MTHCRRKYLKEAYSHAKVPPVINPGSLQSPVVNMMPKLYHPLASNGGLKDLQIATVINKWDIRVLCGTLGYYEHNNYENGK